jgi:CDP-diacylglycerol--glycerol-3-phosphate 3-phosphatidyltransferase
VNLPNAITVARILSVPFFLYLGLQGETDLAAVGAFVLFLAASVSDQIDGYLARKKGLVTRMGEFLDPLADKLLVGAALVVLVADRRFPLWAAILIGVRELAVQILRTQIVRGGGQLPASRGAKLKTITQIVLVSWWLLPWPDPNLVHWILLAATLATTFWSGIEYFVRAQHVEEVSP